MKKHLFLLSSVFALLSLQAQEATMMVAANTNVKVKSGTTLYVGGEMKVANYTNANKVSNEGNIKITGKLTNQNSTGDNFVNEFPMTGKYGQLIINGSSNGQISSVIKLSNNFVYHSFSTPYTDLSVSKLSNIVYQTPEELEYPGYKYERGDNGYYDENRKHNPVFVWGNAGNADKHYLKDLARNEMLVPGNYYAINKNANGGGGFNTDKVSISGIPATQMSPLVLTPYKIEHNNDYNEVGEFYGTYIIDYTQTLPANWSDYNVAAPASENFGANIFNIGNPYTSNIDLGALGLSNVEAFVQYTSNAFDSSSSNSYGGQISSSIDAYIPGIGGDTGLRYVRPFQTVSLKMGGSFTETSVNLGNNAKTFKENSETPNVLFNNRSKEKNNVAGHLKLEVYKDEEFTGYKTHIIAADSYEAARKGKVAEIYNPNMTEVHRGIYTLQENEDGSINERLSKEKTYINGINANKYIAKPIHLVFQNGNGQYTFKADLGEELQNNKNVFYFEDKVTGEVVKVGKDFSYTATVNGTEKDRFVLYWSALPKEEITKEIAEESVDTTVIFKDQNLFKVRFDKEMDTADVFVYSISGQLINIDKKVNTSNDYIVPVKGNASVYIVKIVGNNGKTVTKKIIK